MPSIPIQLGDLLTLASMASKVCENHVDFYAGLFAAGKEVEASQIDGMLHDCISVLGKLDRQNPGLMPVPHDGETWAEVAAKIKES